ncbi:MAG: PrsW family intramembrane metalloprotease [Candidatus Kariarchaeaceae archaeon]
MSFISGWINGPYVWVLIFIIVIFFTLLTILFYYSRDKYEPEPISRIFLAFLLGIFSIIPALILELILVFFVRSEVLIAILVAPIVEEFVKGWMVIYLSRHDNFDGPLDGLIYGAMVGSGFAAAENLFYGFAALYIPEGGISVGLTITTIRSLTQIIGHPLYTGLMGVGVGEYKVGLIHNKYQQIWRSILLHSMWNGAASLPGLIFFAGILGVIIISLYVLKKELSSAIKLDRQAYERGYYEAKRIYLEEQKRIRIQQQQWFSSRWATSPQSSQQNWQDPPGIVDWQNNDQDQRNIDLYEPDRRDENDDLNSQSTNKDIDKMDNRPSKKHFDQDSDI